MAFSSFFLHDFLGSYIVVFPKKRKSIP